MFRCRTWEASCRLRSLLLSSDNASACSPTELSGVPYVCSVSHVTRATTNHHHVASACTCQPR